MSNTGEKCQVFRKMSFGVVGGHMRELATYPQTGWINGLAQAKEKGFSINSAVGALC